MSDKPTTTTQNVVPTTPSQMKPYVDQVLQDSQALYERRLGQGYQPYQGQTIAGFTPEEVASQEGLKGLIGTQAPLQQEALNLARGTDREFTADTAQQYMSPYLRTALDAQKAQAQRQYESVQQPKFEAAAVAAGGMSGLGSRAAVQAAEMDSNQQRMLADIEAAGQQQAYESASQLFQDQTNRERQAASQISTAAPNIYKANIQDMGLLSQIGEDKRGLAQGVLDEAYSKYIEQEQFPEQQLARYQSSIYGSPLLKQPSYSNTTSKTAGGPSTGKTLLGLGAGIMGFGGGNSLGSSLMGGVKSFFNNKSGGGIGSTMKAQEYVNRNMGGPVMPPVVYRQQPGLVDPTGTVTRDEIGNVVSPLNMPPAMATDQRDFDAQYASDMEKGGETPYGLSGLDSATDESAFAQPLAPTVDKPTTLTPLGETVGAATLDNAFKMIGDKLTIDFPALTAGVRKQYTDDSITSEKEIVALNKESSDFQNRSTARIDNYKNDVISLTGNDPNENRNFWFTVAAAVMKPGNAWANLMTGLKEATLASSASQEKKNKLLMMLSKDEMNFKNDLDKIGSASTRSSIKLNAKQERTLNSLPKAIRDEAIKLMTAGASYNNAMAAAAKSSGFTRSEMRKLAALDKGVRINVDKQVAKAFGFTLDDEGDFQGTDKAKKLYQEQTRPMAALYNKMMKAYGSTKNRVEGQKRADKVLFEHSKKKGVTTGVVAPPAPVGTVPVR